MFEITLLIISVLANIALGIIVFVKNTRSATNRLFLMLTTSFVLWSVTNFASIHPAILAQITWIRLVLFFAVFLCLSVYLTFNTFPSTKFTLTRQRTLFFAFSAFVTMSLTLSPFVFRDLRIVNGNAQPVPGPAIAVFALNVGLLLISGIVKLVSRFNQAKGHARSQLRFVLFGLGGSFGLILLTNFVFVVLLNNTSLVPLGPTYTLIFTGAMAYAIVRHRLFDIRAAAARALGYLFSLASIGFIYGAFVFGIVGVLGDKLTVSYTQRIFYVAFALVTALIFPRLKKFFDKLSNRFFFKDAYDPQLLLDELNNVLVRRAEVGALLDESIIVIENSFKSEYGIFLLAKTSYLPERVLGQNKSMAKLRDVATVEEILSDNDKKLLFTDFLDDDQAQLRVALTETNTSVVVSIHSGTAHSRTNIGYLLLGPKKSGYPYTSADARILEIIADELVIAIQNALRFEEIERFNITLQQKIEDATRQLRRTNEKLKALDETKDEFISMASHQLRTPLTSVKGYMSMVLEGDAGKLNSKQKSLLDQAFISSQRMVYLIADLLNVSRLHTGKFVIERQPTQLAEVVEGELHQLTETAKGRGIELTYSKPKDFPELLLDETKTRQVIMNFADNAIYYTPAGGHIQVNLVNKDESVEFTVVDNGIGVPKTAQHHLFTKFYRANNAQRARPDGTGLGLFMAKKVVVAQGGAIIFHSEEGKGSTFGFTFPKHKIQTSQPVHQQS